MIKTVISDIGNVLNGHDWDTFAKNVLGEELYPVMAEVFLESGYWEELDRGVLPLSEVVDLFVSVRPEYEKEIRYLQGHIGGSFFPRYYAIDWIKEIKAAGFQMLYLSNYYEGLMEANPEALEFLPFMDGGIFSCDVKMIKPHLDIYEEILKKYGLQAEECLFIDDRQANVDAAKKVGMHTFLFEGYEKSHDAIMEYLKQHS